MGAAGSGVAVAAVVGWPHALQNAAPSVTFVPHFEQNITLP